MVLYSTQNLDVMLANCFREINPSFLAIDRTFNLGKVFVTVTSIKNTSVVNHAVGHPIIIGSMLLHGDATSEVYGTFLHLMLSGFSFEFAKNVIIGCGDAKSIRKAIRKIISHATYTLCTRHLRENFDNNLKNITGVNQIVRSVIKCLVLLVW